MIIWVIIVIALSSFWYGFFTDALLAAGKDKNENQQL